jgi:hypothetical protein
MVQRPPLSTIQRLTCLQQMAVQAVLDSSPLQLLANTSPAPADVVWPNTYMPRSSRMWRSWSITAFITLLTILWSVVLVPIAGLIDLDRIHAVWPGLADVLEEHLVLKSLVQTQLPTLIISLLNILVPYLYECKHLSSSLIAPLTLPQGSQTNKE